MMISFLEDTYIYDFPEMLELAVLFYESLSFS